MSHAVSITTYGMSIDPDYSSNLAELDKMPLVNVTKA